MALSHVPIFIQAVSRDSDDVKVTSVKVIHHSPPSSTFGYALYLY